MKTFVKVLFRKYLTLSVLQDPEAKKPEDWDDRPTIPDPEDKKPEDWDKPEHIPDPDATKPEDWDDEMDGEWEPPMIDNPDYKGVWAPKQVRTTFCYRSLSFGKHVICSPYI